jgi:hypothetical protein
VGHYRPHELITHLLRSTARMPRRNTKAALAPEDVDSYVKCLSKVVVVRMMKHNKNGMSHDHLPILALLHFGRSRGLFQFTLSLKHHCAGSSAGRSCKPRHPTKTRAIEFSRGLSGIGFLAFREHVRTMHAMSIATWAVY